MTSMTDTEGKEVVTIEGLSPDGNHPVQVAWREINVPQCGFCQTGQIMQAAGLLAQKKSPSDAEILEAMAGGRLPGGCHERIVAAVRLLPRERNPMLHYLNEQLAAAPMAIGRAQLIENVSRRAFLAGNRFGVGLVVAMQLLPFRTAGAFEPYHTGGLDMPNGIITNPLVFVSIDPDGTVTIVAHRSEMGARAPEPACRWCWPTRWRPTGRG